MAPGGTENMSSIYCMHYTYALPKIKRASATALATKSHPHASCPGSPQRSWGTCLQAEIDPPKASGTHTGILPQ
eukprot:6177644-Pleurochrysis_carterae.AAC.1